MAKKARDQEEKTCCQSFKQNCCGCVRDRSSDEPTCWQSFCDFCWAFWCCCCIARKGVDESSRPLLDAERDLSYNESDIVDVEKEYGEKISKKNIYPPDVHTIKVEKRDPNQSMDMSNNADVQELSLREDSSEFKNNYFVGETVQTLYQDFDKKTSWVDAQIAQLYDNRTADLLIIDADNLGVEPEAFQIPLEQIRKLDEDTEYENPPSFHPGEYQQKKVDSKTPDTDYEEPPVFIPPPQKRNPDSPQSENEEKTNELNTTKSAAGGVYFGQFDGLWTTKNGQQFEVAGDTIYWPGGSKSTFSALDDKIFFSIQDEEYTGMVADQKRSIHWADGDVWRLVSPFKGTWKSENSVKKFTIENQKLVSGTNEYPYEFDNDGHIAFTLDDVPYKGNMTNDGNNKFIRFDDGTTWRKITVFDGNWVSSRGDDVYVIDGSHITWAKEKAICEISEETGNIEFENDMQQYHGKLDNDNEIHWSNGETWRKTSNFDGVWIAHDGASFSIQGSKVHWALSEGANCEIDKTEIVFSLQGRKYKGHLRENSYKIVWLDGDVWTRAPAIDGTWASKKGKDKYVLKGNKVYGPRGFEQLFDLDHNGNISYPQHGEMHNGILSDDENNITWSNGEMWRKLTPFDGLWVADENVIGKYEVEGNVLRTPGGEEAAININEFGYIQYISGDVRRSGQISDEEGNINWSDGSVWKRASPYDGIWQPNEAGVEQQFEIDKKVVRTPSGTETQCEVNSDGEIEFILFNEKFIGELSPEKDTIIWSDGTSWTKRTPYSGVWKSKKDGVAYAIDGNVIRDPSGVEYPCKFNQQTGTVEYRRRSKLITGKIADDGEFIHWSDGDVWRTRSTHDGVWVNAEDENEKYTIEGAKLIGPNGEETTYEVDDRNMIDFMMNNSRHQGRIDDQNDCIHWSDGSVWKKSSPLDGSWHTDQSTSKFRIDGKKIISSEHNGEIPYEIDEDGIIKFELDEELHVGQVSDDQNEITWSDGQVWQRKTAFNGDWTSENENDAGTFSIRGHTLTFPDDEQLQFKVNKAGILQYAFGNKLKSAELFDNGNSLQWDNGDVWKKISPFEGSWVNIKDKRTYEISGNSIVGPNNETSYFEIKDDSNVIDFVMEDKFGKKIEGQLSNDGNDVIWSDNTVWRRTSPIDGKWRSMASNNSTAPSKIIVEGNRISSRNGMDVNYQIDKNGNIQFELDGESYRGILSADKSHMTWSNGDVWVRNTPLDGRWKVEDDSKDTFYIEDGTVKCGNEQAIVDFNELNSTVQFGLNGKLYHGKITPDGTHIEWNDKSLKNWKKSSHFDGNWMSSDSKENFVIDGNTILGSDGAVLATWDADSDTQIEFSLDNGEQIGTLSPSRKVIEWSDGSIWRRSDFLNGTWIPRDGSNKYVIKDDLIKSENTGNETTYTVDDYVLEFKIDDKTYTGVVNDEKPSITFSDGTQWSRRTEFDGVWLDENDESFEVKGNIVKDSTSQKVIAYQNLEDQTIEFEIDEQEYIGQLANNGTEIQFQGLPSWRKTGGFDGNWTTKNGQKLEIKDDKIKFPGGLESKFEVYDEGKMMQFEIDGELYKAQIRNNRKNLKVSNGDSWRKNGTFEGTYSSPDGTMEFEIGEKKIFYPDGSSTYVTNENGKIEFDTNVASYVGQLSENKNELQFSDGSSWKRCGPFDGNWISKNGDPIEVKGNVATFKDTDISVVIDVVGDKMFSVIEGQQYSADIQDGNKLISWSDGDEWSKVGPYDGTWRTVEGKEFQVKDNMITWPSGGQSLYNIIDGDKIQFSLNGDVFRGTVKDYDNILWAGGDHWWKIGQHDGIWMSKTGEKVEIRANVIHWPDDTTTPLDVKNNGKINYDLDDGTEMKGKVSGDNTIIWSDGSIWKQFTEGEDENDQMNAIKDKTQEIEDLVNKYFVGEVVKTIYTNLDGETTWIDSSIRALYSNGTCDLHVLNADKIGAIPEAVEVPLYKIKKDNEHEFSEPTSSSDIKKKYKKFESMQEMVENSESSHAAFKIPKKTPKFATHFSAEQTRQAPELVTITSEAGEKKALASIISQETNYGEFDEIRRSRILSTESNFDEFNEAPRSENEPSFKPSSIMMVQSDDHRSSSFSEFKEEMEILRKRTDEEQENWNNLPALENLRTLIQASPDSPACDDDASMDSDTDKKMISKRSISSKIRNIQRLNSNL